MAWDESIDRSTRWHATGSARWEPRGRTAQTRMLCTECLHLGAPDTVLEGSDRVELAAWCLLGLPGLVYCGWRHLNRFKTCAACGSPALMRECRAAAGRRPPLAPTAVARVRSLGSDFAWPRPFGSTRVRLRSGSVAALLIALAGVAALLGVLELAPEPRALQTASASGLLGLGWLGHMAQQVARLRSGRCEAWDARGRPLRIESV